MVVDDSLSFSLADHCFVLRDAGPEDVNEVYLRALQEGSPYIGGIPSIVTRDTQAAYIRSVRESPRDSIIGLFSQDGLVGTSGVQIRSVSDFTVDMPIDSTTIATVGIFIFDRRYRGIGLGSALVWAAVRLHAKATDQRFYGAGMKRDNLPSYRAFLRCGFTVVARPPGEYRVGVAVDRLVRPAFVQAPEQA